MIKHLSPGILFWKQKSYRVAAHSLVPPMDLEGWQSLRGRKGVNKSWNKEFEDKEDRAHK